MATAPRDFYEVLGVAEGRLAGRDQEGLPEAGPQVAPGPQPGRRGGRGALQGDPAGLRHALRPREAQAVRRRRHVRRLRRRRLPGGGRASPAAASPRISATSSPRSSAAAASRARASSAGATSRPRCGSPSTRRWTAPRSPSRCRRTATVPDLPRQRRQAGDLAAHLPALRGARHRRPEPGPLLDQPAVPASAAATARSSTTRARPATAAASPSRRKRYRVNIPAGVHDGSRIRLAGKGEAGYRRRPARRPLRDHPGRARRRSSSSAPTATSRSTSRSRSPRRSRARDIEVPTLDGTKTIRIPPGTQHGTVQRLRGEGPPRPKGTGRGDIHYRIRIEVPKELDRRAARGASRSSPRSLNGQNPRGLAAREARRPPRTPRPDHPAQRGE